MLPLVRSVRMTKARASCQWHYWRCGFSAVFTGICRLCATLINDVLSFIWTIGMAGATASGQRHHTARFLATVFAIDFGHSVICIKVA